MRPTLLTTPGEYEEAVRTVVQDHNRLRVAVAFWGAGIEKIFSERSSPQDVELVCNLMSGGCNPHVIEALLSRFDIRMSDRLHAKVLIGDDCAIVGSANLSANGLALEGAEATHWFEAGLLTSCAATVGQVEEWFQQLWKDSRRIETRDLEAAKERWLIQRQTRPSRITAGLIADLPLSEVLDRDAWVAIWRDDADKAGYRLFADVKRSMPKEIDPAKIAFWQDWDDLPRERTLIDVRYGVQGGIVVGPAYRRIPILDPVPRNETSIQVSLQERDVLGYRFTIKQRRALSRAIRANVATAWRHSEGDAVVISLAQAMYGQRAITQR
jgi:hypothetical protein